MHCSAVDEMGMRSVEHGLGQLDVRAEGYDQTMTQALGDEFERVTIATPNLSFEALAAGPLDGPVVVALHGFPDHALTFVPLMADLSKAGFRAIAPWMPGYHPTAVPEDGDFSLGALASHVMALIDAVSPDAPVALVGHDWGALVGYAVAGWKPERLTHLTTMAVPHMATMMMAMMDPAQLKRSWYMFFFQQPTAEFVVAANDMALIDTLWADWSPGFTPETGFVRSLKESMAPADNLTAVLGYYRAMFNPTVAGSNPAADAGALGAIDVPALYLHGVDDGCMGVESVDEGALGGLFPRGVDVRILDRAGHFLHLEQPDDVNALILDALARTG